MRSFDAVFDNLIFPQHHKYHLQNAVSCQANVWFMQDISCIGYVLMKNMHKTHKYDHIRLSTEMQKDFIFKDFVAFES